MRGYKINKEGIIEEVFDTAPSGAKNQYTGTEGVYTETAINKIIAQSVRYSEYIRLKSDRERIEVELEDTQAELTRKINDDTNNKNTIKELESVLSDKQTKAEQLQKDLQGIKHEIDNVLGGAL